MLITSNNHKHADQMLQSGCVSFFYVVLLHWTLKQVFLILFKIFFVHKLASSCKFTVTLCYDYSFNWRYFFLPTLGWPIHLRSQNMQKNLKTPNPAHLGFVVYPPKKCLSVCLSGQLSIWQLPIFMLGLWTWKNFCLPYSWMTDRLTDCLPVWRSDGAALTASDSPVCCWVFLMCCFFCQQLFLSVTVSVVFLIKFPVDKVCNMVA